MKKLLSILIVILGVSCSMPKKKTIISKAYDGFKVVNPQDDMIYQLQFIKEKGGYDVVLPDTIPTSDSTFYLVHPTIK